MTERIVRLKNPRQAKKSDPADQKHDYVVVDTAGNVILEIQLTDYDAGNYAKAMGYQFEFNLEHES